MSTTEPKRAKQCQRCGARTGGSATNVSSVPCMKIQPWCNQKVLNALVAKANAECEKES